MKAFISNTLGIDNDKSYVVSSIAFMLDDLGYKPHSSPSNSENEIDLRTKVGIRSANLFIGLLTDDGDTPNSVYNEWKMAIKYRVPSILLVEDTLDFNSYDFDEDYRGNVIRFSRKNPEIAVAEIKEKIKASRLEENPKRLENIVAWLTGGQASMRTIQLLARQPI